MCNQLESLFAKPSVNTINHCRQLSKLWERKNLKKNKICRTIVTIYHYLRVTEIRFDCEKKIQHFCDAWHLCESFIIFQMSAYLGNEDLSLEMPQ